MLSDALALVGNMTEGEAKEDLHDHESLVLDLERIGSQGDDSADKWIRAVQRDVTWTALLMAMASSAGYLYQE